MDIKNIFHQLPPNTNGVYLLSTIENSENQTQTKDIFSNKWGKVVESGETEKAIARQKKWYLELYGFDTENDLRNFLQTKKIILDAGCGYGYKAAWFARLSPNSQVIAMDYSDAIFNACKKYCEIENLTFIKGDISDTQIKPNTLDYISCDQVIHHTEFPEKTFSHLCDILKLNGEFACYVYAKKALPRELLDDHFREYAKQLGKDELWKMSEQLTQLGKRLDDLNVTFDAPDIPLMGIKGGRQSVQRFIYWNFLKCFWNEDVGMQNSIATNFDWYGPSNAYRYSESEFKEWVVQNSLETLYFHIEPACYSGRFKKRDI